jgi:hypothetical protein
MRLFVQTTFLMLFLLIIFSCSGRGRGAAYYLVEAEEAYNAGNYSLAKLKIDSIKALFPKSFNEINSGFQLMQQVRMAENKRNIAFCDSMLRVNYNELNEMLTKFDYVRDDRYQEFGEYHPKAYPHKNSLNNNGLRSIVSEKGDLFIESVLSGTHIKHNQIRVSSNDGSFAETLVVTADGLNYRFSTLEKTYEIVRYGSNDENSVSQYIYSYRDKPITLHFIGNRTITTNLTQGAKNAVSQSYELSNLLKSIEQLKHEKEKSEVLIRYLESRKE